MGYSTSRTAPTRGTRDRFALAVLRLAARCGCSQREAYDRMKRILPADQVPLCSYGMLRQQIMSLRIRFPELTKPNNGSYPDSLLSIL